MRGQNRTEGRGSYFWACVHRYQLLRSADAVNPKSSGFKTLAESSELEGGGQSVIMWHFRLLQQFTVRGGVHFLEMLRMCVGGWLLETSFEIIYEVRSVWQTSIYHFALLLFFVREIFVCLFVCFLSKSFITTTSVEL